MGCATVESAQEAPHHNALCILSALEGRLDVLPSGPGSIGVRVVALDRAATLSSLTSLKDEFPPGLSRVRVEAPRPMLALILHVQETSPAIAAALAWTPFPISLAIESKHPAREEIEDWAKRVALSLIIIDDNAHSELPKGLSTSEGHSLMGLSTKEMRDALEMSARDAERHGASWLQGSLNRETLEVIDAFVTRHPERLHLVAYEAVMRPPTTPQWRRQCHEGSD